DDRSSPDRADPPATPARRAAPPELRSRVARPTKPSARRRERHARVLPTNLYAADAAGRLSRVAAKALPRVYVPNSESGSGDVINPRTYRVVGHFRVGRLPQHITPAFDLRVLYVDSDAGNTLTPIDPATGAPGRPIPVADPYNLYFTPDGRSAIVVAERLQRL